MYFPSDHSDSIKKTSCDNSACQFSQNWRRTTGAIEFTVYLVYIYSTRHSFQVFASTYKMKYCLCWNQWEFWYWFQWNHNSGHCLFLSGLRKILKKTSGKPHHRDPTHYSHFSYSKRKKCFHSMGKPCCLPSARICIESIWSAHQQVFFSTDFWCYSRKWVYIFFHWFGY